MPEGNIYGLLLTWMSVMNNYIFPWCLNSGRHSIDPSIAAVPEGLLKLEAFWASAQHLSVNAFCCFIHLPLVLPFCSGDYWIITEIYIVLEEIGGLSPGVMFKGPSLHWSALSHWFLPSLSPISRLSALLPEQRCPLTSSQTMAVKDRASSNYFRSEFLCRIIFIYMRVYFLLRFRAEGKRAVLLLTNPGNHPGSSVLRLAAAAMLWLVACR